MRKSSRKGTPQGGVISPLLSNIYLHWFDKVFHSRDGAYYRYGARLVRYADDAVIMYQSPNANLVRWVDEKLEGWLGLKVNKEKSRIVKLRKTRERLDFLGYSFKYQWSHYAQGRRYVSMYPSSKSVIRQIGKLRSMLGTHMQWKPIKELAKEVNRNLVGWSGYFGIGYCGRAYSKINKYLENKVTRHLRRKSQKGFRFPNDRSTYAFIKELGFQFLLVNKPKFWV